MLGSYPEQSIKWLFKNIKHTLFVGTISASKGCYRVSNVEQIVHL
jgi:hypothetical protein